AEPISSCDGHSELSIVIAIGNSRGGITRNTCYGNSSAILAPGIGCWRSSGCSCSCYSKLGGLPDIGCRVGGRCCDDWSIRGRSAYAESPARKVVSHPKGCGASCRRDPVCIRLICIRRGPGVPTLREGTGRGIGSTDSQSFILRGQTHIFAL